MEKTILVVGSPSFADEVQEVLSPLDIRVVNGTGEERIRDIYGAKDITLTIFDDDSYPRDGKKKRQKVIEAVKASNPDFFFVSSHATIARVEEAKGFGARDYVIKPFNYREFIARVNAVLHSRVRIACVGGGTGLFHVLLGLKKLPHILLTSIVSMSDDGGSSGRLKASFGVLPPGDIRRSLVALSNAPEVMNELMRYRFQKGEGLAGHNFGNLLLTVLSEIKGSFREAAKATSDILNVQGIVIGVTNTPTTLCARFENGMVVKGESRIDLSEGRDTSLRVKELWHEPEVESNIEAFSDIMNSDFLIIGPGDLYTSIITNLLVKNVGRAIARTKAKKIYICNLMTKPGETSGFTAYDHVKEMVDYMEGDYLDYIIISNTQIRQDAIAEYAKKDQHPVAVGDIEKILKLTRAEIIITDVGHEAELVRHDSVKLRNAINDILITEKRI